jgi:hypothetical protein
MLDEIFFRLYRGGRLSVEKVGFHCSYNELRIPCVTLKTSLIPPAEKLYIRLNLKIFQTGPHDLYHDAHIQTGIF